MGGGAEAAVADLFAPAHEGLSLEPCGPTGADSVCGLDAGSKVGKRGAGPECLLELRVELAAAGSAMASDGALGQRRIHSPNTGDLSGRVNGRDAGVLAFVDGHELIKADGAAGREGQLDARGESVADADCVGSDAALGARDRSPVLVDSSDGDGLDAIGAMRGDDGTARAVRDAVDEVVAQVTERLPALFASTEQAPRLGQPPAEHSAEAAGFEDSENRCTGLSERSGDGKQEWACTGNDNALTDGNTLALGECLSGTGGEDAGQIPAGKRQGAVVGAGGKYQGVGGEAAALTLAAVDRADEHVHGGAGVSPPA